MFRVLAGGYPSAVQRASLVRRAVEGAGFDELVAEVAAIEGSADRSIDRMRPALQAHLRWDFERTGRGADQLSEPRVVFMHIMKTGRTSLSQICSGWAAPGRARVHLYIDDLLLTPLGR